MRYLLPLAALCAACGSPMSGPDAGDAGPAIQPTPTFCFGRPKLEFCEDFDGDPLPGAFDTAVNTGGAANIDEAASTSAPRSVSMRSTGDGAQVTLSKQVTGEMTFKTFLQLRVDAKPASGAVEVLSLGGQADHYGVWLSATDELSVVADGQTLGSMQMPSSDWLAVRLDVGHDGGTRYVSFKLGDATVVNRQPVLAAPSLSSPTFTVGLGADAGAGWNVRFDTITFIYD